MYLEPSARLALALGPVLSALACSPAATSQDAKNGALSHAGETWCPAKFEQGPSDTCFSVPEHSTKDTPILVYLHGMYEGHGSAQEWEAMRIASEQGFAIVIPRGRHGLCAWRSELKDYFCWPQDAEDKAGMKSLIAEWDRVLWQVDALLEPGTHKRYVLGYSDGGAFAAFIATHGLFPGQAYAVVNGNNLAPPGKAKPVPMLLVSGQEDAEHAPKMRDMHDALGKAGWAHAFCPRAGTAPITNDDVEVAVKFFKHDADGTLKASGGSYPCDAPSARR